MNTLEWILVLLLGAVALNAAAKRAGVPYPTLLALAGAAIAFIPNGPRLPIEPDIMLALFVAPVLLDAAYDTSLRDLRDNWLPVGCLVLVAVGVTTLAVALAARALVPDLPWSAAVALGAIVAPPDAAAATSILRQLDPPHRILVILEGESLLNDASALLIYRIAVGAAVGVDLDAGHLALTFAIVVPGSLVAGLLLGLIVQRIVGAVTQAPSSIILQFCGTIGVWLVADRLGLSPVLTIVAYAISIAQRAQSRMPARLRIPSYAVWETTVYLLNVLAFVLIGLQVRPILESTPGARLREDLAVAAAVLGTVVVARLAWVLAYNTALRIKNRIFGVAMNRPMLVPTLASGLVVGWCGMRGIVTLAAALALPGGFPHRDLVVLCAASVVLGTLVLQGLTLRPLLGWIAIADDDPVGRETAHARAVTYRAMLKLLENEDSPAATALRVEYAAVLESGDEDCQAPSGRTANEELRLRTLTEARAALLDLRRSRAIGDAAFHRLEEEFDRAEVHVTGG